MVKPYSQEVFVGWLAVSKVNPENHKTCLVQHACGPLLREKALESSCGKLPARVLQEVATETLGSITRFARIAQLCL